MKIVLIGQAAFAEKVLDGLRANGHDVLALYCPPDGPSGKLDPAKVRAQALGIPVYQHASLKRPEVRGEFEAFGADLAVLAYVTQIVPQSVFEVPRLGSICFHPSLLPAYRGGSAVNWQIIKGEAEAGVSVFWVDPGIDTGPLIVQKRAPIGADDTAGTLYYNTLFPIGIDATLEAVEQIAAGKAGRDVQDESRATYDPLCRDEHARIDWSRPSNEVHNLIRGCDPQPGAYSEWQGNKVRFYDSRRVDGSSFAPGVVAAIDADGIVVGTGSGAVRLKRAKGPGAKADAQSVAAECGITIGARL